MSEKTLDNRGIVTGMALRCDVEGCAKALIFDAATASVLRLMAADCGWMYFEDQDFCSGHWSQMVLGAKSQLQYAGFAAAASQLSIRTPDV